jgi:hypothetical protein
MRHVGKLLAWLALIAALPSLAAFAAWHDAQRVRHTGIDDSAVLLRMVVGPGFGSGVLLKDGVVLTAAHVASMGQLRARTSDGAEHDTKVASAWPEYDVALLQLKGVSPTLPTRQIACREPRVAERVTVSGFPGLGETRFQGPATTAGIVASRLRTMEVDGPREFVWLDVTAIGGLSGSALLDRSGNVIGIMVFIWAGSAVDEDGDPVLVPLLGRYSGINRLPADGGCEMTVIAYKDGVMASDSGLFWDDNYCIGTVQKLYRLDNGALYGGAGETDDRQLRALLGEYGPECPVEKLQHPDLNADYQVLLAMPDGALWYVQITRNEEHEGGSVEAFQFKSPMAAIGYGRWGVFGAMVAGKTAAEAIEIMLPYLTNAKPPVQTMPLKE